MIIVRASRRDPLFSNETRTRLIQLLSTETVSHYTNYLARLSEPGIPTEELFHEIFYPEVWADYQVLVNLLQHLVSDCRERAELNRIEGDSRTRWASLGLMLEGLNEREYVMAANDAASLIDGMTAQDRTDRAAIAIRSIPVAKPPRPESENKVYNKAAQKYALNLWIEYRNKPGDLTRIAEWRGIGIDLQGRKVSYEDVYRVHAADKGMTTYDIKSAKAFERLVRAAQTQLRREASSESNKRQN